MSASITSSGCTSETCQDRDCPRWVSGRTVTGENGRACGSETARRDLRERWCNLADEDRYRNVKRGWIPEAADEHSRSLMAGEDLVADFVAAEIELATKDLRAQLESSREDVRRLLAVQGLTP